MNLRFAALLLLAGCSSSIPAARAAQAIQTVKPTTDTAPVVHTEEEWKQLLSPTAFDILRHQGTERAFTGAFAETHDAGIYICAGCGAILFSTDDKFDSGTGWPSFTRAVDPARVKLTTDSSLGMARTEVSCARCGGHLGHVFDDGPKPTGMRYCMNSAALQFVPGSPKPSR